MIKTIFIPNYSKENPYQKALEDSLLKQGVKVVYGVNFSFFKLLNSIKLFGKPNIFHIHWHHPYMIDKKVIKRIFKPNIFIIEIIILKLLGVKIVWTVHNILDHEGRFKSFELFYSRILAKLCDQIIVHGSSARKKVSQEYKVKKPMITIILHGNYIGYYENKIDRREARQTLNIPEERTVLLYFGHIKPYKGLNELIEVFQTLNFPRLQLLIVGAPFNKQFSEEIKTKTKNNTRIRTIYGFVPNDDIQIYMNAADAIVLPYRDVLTSGASVLAMSFGKAIVAPNIGTIPDYLDLKGNILYEPSDKNGLCRAINKVMHSNLNKMGEHNFELAKKLQWDEIARKTVDVYRKCLSKQE